MGPRFKVAITHDHPMVPFDQEAIKKLGAECELKVCLTDTEMVELARGCDALVTDKEPCTRRVIESLDRCRLIVTPKIGFDNIDAVAATEKGILISNAGDYSKEAVSDQAMMLLLACARKLPLMVKACRQGKWTELHCDAVRALWPPMAELRGQTLGLVGLGKIAQALVPKAKGFGMKLIACDPYLPPQAAAALGVELVSFERLLAESDFISIHATYTKDNYRMFSMEQFRKMKRSAFLINTARGQLVDEEALLDALRQGLIRGAGLDVLDGDRIAPDSPFLAMDNVIITPHTGHYSDSGVVRLPRLGVEEVIRVMRGEWPRIIVNPKAKDKYQERWGEQKPPGEVSS